MSTTNCTANYGLSQYTASDPVKFLTNYNQDMAAIDGSIKAAKDTADASVPQTRTVAGLPLCGDLALAQLTAAGLASGDESGNAQNALKLGGNPAADYPQITSGTWTAGIVLTGSGSVTIGSQTCSYVKIGTKVHVSANIQLSAVSSPTGEIEITGIPFAVQSYSNGNLQLRNTSLTVGSGLLAIGAPNQNYFILAYASRPNNDVLSAASLTSSSLIRFSADYITA